MLPNDVAAPLSVPHPFWKALASVPNNFPWDFDYLPDNGPAAVCLCIETLAAQEQLSKLSDAVKIKYSQVFNPILHIDDLPTDMYCHIKLKDVSKEITTHAYNSPQKFKDALAQPMPCLHF